MKPAPFQYHAPRTIEEAVATLARVAPDDGRVLAGGQSLVPTMAFRLARPRHLVDINGVAALSRLVVENGKLCIGATVRHAAFERLAAWDPKIVKGGLNHVGRIGSGAVYPGAYNAFEQRIVVWNEIRSRHCEELKYIVKSLQ